VEPLEGTDETNLTSVGLLFQTVFLTGIVGCASFPMTHNPHFSTHYSPQKLNNSAFTDQSRLQSKDCMKVAGCM
jgi:hypothetical protein